PAGEADRLRRRITGKGAEEAAAAGEAFLAACERQGVARPVAELVLAQAQRFRSYSFCKSHAVSYALVASQGGYLKANDALAFWGAALNHPQGDPPRRVYVEAVKRAGLAVLPPCVNRSQHAWTQEVGGVRVGFAAVRSLSGQGAQAVIDGRAG